MKKIVFYLFALLVILPLQWNVAQNDVKSKPSGILSGVKTTYAGMPLNSDSEKNNLWVKSRIDVF